MTCYVCIVCVYFVQDFEQQEDCTVIIKHKNKKHEL